MPVDATGLLFAAMMRDIRQQFVLDWHGIHGAAHWARVRHHGLALAHATGADPRIPALFSVIHDSQRRNEGHDPEHGFRAAIYAGSLRDRGLLKPDDVAFALLQTACVGHSDGGLKAELAVQVCWDADRLDLGRVGVRPDPARLCTQAARDPSRIAYAWQWSQKQRP